MENNSATNSDYGLVSVVMPNFNSEKYLEEAVRSVLNQSYCNLELLFVDDCSTDGSMEIIKRFDDARIKIFSTEKNSGAAVARNIGIKNAIGRWIAFLDSDDLWLPTKLEKQLRFMTDGDVAFSFTHYRAINADGKMIACFNPKKSEYGYKQILRHNSIGCLTAIYDAQRLGKVFMPVSAEKREDFACWLSILKTGVKARCMSESLSLYRVRGNSVSSKKTKMIKYQWRVYRRVEKLNVFKSFAYLSCWMVSGVFKYR